MPSIIQRGGSWQAKVRRKGAPALTRTFDRKVDAEGWARELEREYQRGNMSALRAEAQRVTVGEVMDLYLSGPVKGMKSGRDVAPRIEAARKRFGGVFIGNVRGADIAAWRDVLSREGLAPQTVLHYLNALSGVFRHAEQELSIDLPAGNPVRKIRKPSMPKARDRRLRPGEFDALLAAADAPGAAVGLRQIILLAVETSMRQGELLALRWDRVDLQRRTAHLEDSKNGESRTVALSSVAVDALRALPRRLDGSVFPWKTGSGFESIWKRCLVRARREYVHARLREQLTAEELDGAAEVRALVYKKRQPHSRTVALLVELERTDPFLVDLRFHDLRHEATSRLFEKGLGIMEVASMTGHKSLAMLKRYTHVEAERLAQKLG